MVTFGDAHWAELIRPQRWAGVRAYPPQRQGKARIIGFQDTVENVGDVFLGHSVVLAQRQVYFSPIRVAFVYLLPLCDARLRRKRQTLW